MCDFYYNRLKQCYITIFKAAIFTVAAEIKAKITLFSNQYGISGLPVTWISLYGAFYARQSPSTLAV